MKNRTLKIVIPVLLFLIFSALAGAQDLASFEKRVTVKKLSNGLTLAICERPEAPVFSFFTMVDAGSAQDPMRETGMADMFEHVNRVTAKYLHQNQLAVLAVGNTKEFDKPLTSLGPVKEINIAIPPPAQSGSGNGGQSGGAKPAASDPDGLVIAQKVAAAMGGLDKLKAVKTMRVSIAQSEPGGPPSPVEIAISFPDSMHVEVQTPQGDLTIVTSPDQAFMSMGNMGTRSMPPAQNAEMLAQLHHDLVYIAQHASDLTFTFTSAGTEQIGGVTADLVDVGGVVPWIRWFVDPKTGYILREKYHGLGRDGAQFDGETDLADWRPFDGLMLPALHKNKQNGKETSVVEYKKVEINPVLDPKLFEKPAEKPAQ